MMLRRALVLVPAILSMLVLALPSAATERPASFADIEGSVHEDAVSALAAQDIIRGCGDGRFCARDALTRGQVATIVAKAHGLPPVDDAAPSRFRDTADNVHRGSIEAIAAAGLAAGCEPERFCPQDPISREQLAAMLTQAFDVPAAPEGQRYFSDVGGVHAPAVASITEAGISNGCDLVSFCSKQPLQRVHAAAFFARALDLVERIEVAPFAERLAEHEQRVAREQAAADAAAAEREAAEREAAEREAAEREAETAAAAAAAPGAKAVEVALAQLGKPYRWGGSGPNNFDCSGLTSYAWAAAGVELPRTSRAQYTATTRISRSELRPGDLVFYHSPISHVAIYMGDGRVVEAPNSGNDVRIREDGLTRRGIVGYGRP